MSEPTLVIDDRLLVEHLLTDLELPPSQRIMTTSTWYFRATRAAVIGAGGQLSGPFTSLGVAEQSAAIRSLLTLPETIGLPDPRATVPTMAKLAERHPKLNLLNLEAVATAVVEHAQVALSPRAASGVLPEILTTASVSWVEIRF